MTVNDIAVMSYYPFLLIPLNAFVSLVLLLYNTEPDPPIPSTVYCLLDTACVRQSIGSCFQDIPLVWAS